MQEDVLQLSIVFKALSKPSTIMGVHYDYFFMEGIFIMLAFIYSGNFLMVLLFMPLHALGWILNKVDPHIFQLLSVRASIGAVRHKKIWGCQSYGEF